MTAMPAPLLALEQISKRFGWQLFPLERTVLSGEPQRQ
jgi:hypothetical protein